MSTIKIKRSLMKNPPTNDSLEEYLKSVNKYSLTQRNYIAEFPGTWYTLSISFDSKLGAYTMKLFNVNSNEDFWGVWVFKTKEELTKSLYQEINKRDLIKKVKDYLNGSTTSSSLHNSNLTNLNSSDFDEFEIWEWKVDWNSLSLNDRHTKLREWNIDTVKDFLNSYIFHDEDEKLYYGEFLSLLNIEYLYLLDSTYLTDRTIYWCYELIKSYYLNTKEIDRFKIFIKNLEIDVEDIDYLKLINEIIFIKEKEEYRRKQLDTVEWRRELYSDTLVYLLYQEIWWNLKRSYST